MRATVPPSAREIAHACGEDHRASDWAHGPLREMAWYGLVEVVGITFDNARTWRITEAGRALLAQGIDARSGETRAAGLGPKDECPVAEGDAPIPLRRS